MVNLHKYFFVLGMLISIPSLLLAQCPFLPPGSTVNSTEENLLTLNFGPGSGSAIEVCGLTEGNTYTVSTCEFILTFDPQIQIYSSDGNQLIANDVAGCGLPNGAATASFVAGSDDCVQIQILDSSCSINNSMTASFVCSSCAPPESVTASPSSDPDLITQTLLASGCSEISNMQISAYQGAVGTFAGGAAIGLNGGVVLSSGDVYVSQGPNPGTGQGIEAYFGSGDPDLAGLINFALNDISIIEFDFLPSGDLVQFDYVFASEEYCDFANGTFNDVFGFFISGPGINGPFSNGAENLALIPGTSSYVGVNSINHTQNVGYYNSNVTTGEQLGCTGETAGIALGSFGYDGFTDVFTASTTVIPCELYHIKLAIADAGDAAFDSAVFIGANSFNTGDNSSVSFVVPSTNGTTSLEGCTDAFILFQRPEEEVDEDLTIEFTVSDASTAIPIVDYLSLPPSITIPAGQASLQIPLVAYPDDILEGPETIIIELESGCGCSDPVTVTELIINIDDTLPIVAISDTIQACTGITLTLEPMVENPVGELSYFWPIDGSEAANYELSVTEETSLDYEVRDACGRSAVGSFVIEIIEPGSSVIDTSACFGESVLYFGSAIAAGASQDVVISGLDGCETVVTVNVAALENSASSLDTIACFDSSIDFLGSTLAANSVTDFAFTNVLGCDSIVTVNVAEVFAPEYQIDTIACEGESLLILDQFVPSGSSTQITIPGSYACDTLVTVTVNSYPTASSIVDTAVCLGSTISFAGATLQIGDSEDFLFSTVQNCDSIVTINVNELSSYFSIVDTSVCENESLDFLGEELVPDSSSDFQFISQQGCDSIVSVIVASLPTSYVQLDTAACEGDLLQILGQGIVAGSDQVFELSSTAGCDSTVLVNVAALPLYETVLDTFACPEAFVLIEGTEIAAGESALIALQSTENCDSILSVNVLEKQIYFETIDTFACPGATILFDGFEVFEGTPSVFTYSSEFNCDSSIQVIVTTWPENEVSVDTLVCTGGSIIIEGQEFSPPASSQLQLLNALGCDSLVNLAVLATDVLTSSSIELVCPDESYTFEGTEIAIGETADFSYSTSSGCDSIHSISVQAHLTFEVELDTASCPGSELLLGDDFYPAGFVGSRIESDANGCDSLINIFIEELVLPEISLDTSACPGTEILLAGNTYPAGFIGQISEVDANGCDSLVNIFVEELPVIEVSVDTSACVGSALLLGDALYTPGFEGLLVETAANGCDSLINLRVLELANSESALDTSVCVGSSVTINSDVYEAGSSTALSLSNSIGCDSTVYINVLALSDSESYIDTTACPGTVLFFNGIAVSRDTSFNLVFVNSFGCDSIVQINFRPTELACPSILFPNAFSPNGDGINDSFGGLPNVPLQEYVLRVFDRWGQLVFESLDPNHKWDGSKQGEVLPLGVYVYFARATAVGGELLDSKGNVSLLR